MKPVILLDSCVDLPGSYLKERNVDVIYLSYNLEGEEYLGDGQISAHEFYEKLRGGLMSTTSLISVGRFIPFFEKYAEEGVPTLYLAFSSALSGTYNSALIAVDTLKEKYPQCDIRVFDSKAASLGLGLLADYVLNMRDEGKSRDEIWTWLEANHLNLQHWFTVDDLGFLHRGGRVSKKVAIVGSLLSIKPILNVDSAGKLTPHSKVKSRKRSLQTLVDKFTEWVVEPENQPVFISHGDCIEDAEILAEIIKAKYNVKRIFINDIGPVIGSHSGPGTVALFFMGRTRAEGSAE